MIPGRFILLALVPVLVAMPTLLTGQALMPKREQPAIAWAGCAASLEKNAEVTAAQRQEAERLAAAATEASLLGDKAAVLELITQASRLDPTSSSIAYQLARVLDDAGRPTEALAAYCRYLELMPDAADTEDIKERTRALGNPPGFAVPAAAGQAFGNGLAHYDARRLAEAETAFTEASRAATQWSAPLYNRALVRLALGRTNEAAEDLRQYLALNPDSPDFAQVVDLIASLRRTAAPQYNPSSALVRGLIMPGLGHFTTGRTGTGVLFFGVGALALAAGIVVDRVSVQCLSPPVNGECPPGQVYHEEKDRPYLVPGIATFAAAAIVGAIDAYRGAKKSNAELDTPRFGVPSGARQPYLEPPAFSVGLDKARVDLIRIRF